MNSDKKDYAILFKREVLNGEHGIYIYKPCYAISGIYDEINNTFLDAMNEERYLYDDPELINTDEEFCVGNLCTEDSLIATYPSAEDPEAAMMYYNSDAMCFMYIGIYDMVNDKINVIRLELDKFSQIYKSDNNITPLLSNDKKNDDEVIDDSIETSESDMNEDNFYDIVKKQYGNHDFTMFLKNEIDELLKMNDINEVKHYLLELKKDKNKYYSKLNPDGDTELIIMDDSNISKLLQKDSLEEIKEYIRSSIKDIGIEEKTPRDLLFEYYSDINSCVMACQTLEQVKELLLEAKKEFVEVLEKTEKFEDKSITYVKFLNLQIQGINVLLKLTSLNEIKEKFQELYDASLEYLAIACNEMYGEIEEQKEIKPEEKMDQKDYEKLFKIKSDEEVKDSIKEELDKLNNLVGLENVKEMVKRITARMIFNNKTEGLLNIEKPSMNMVFTGNPGTGKTTVASIIAPIFHKLGYLTSDKVKVVAAEDLIAGYVGQTAIKTKKIIDENKGGLIILDEAYILAGEAQEFGPEALTVILKEMETNRTSFIFAGYEKEMTEFIKMNSGIKSRIKPRNFVKFKDYSTDELLEMFKNLVNTISIDETKKLKLGEGTLDKAREKIEIAKRNKDFGNARYVNSLFQEIIDEHAMNVESATSIDDLLTISINDIPDQEIKVKTRMGFY